MKITEKDRKLVAEILTQFMFTKNMDDVMKVWDDIYNKYDLCDDPFTQTPCTREEFFKNTIEYERQIRLERYGHCDGLE
jgi:hypothetical protein